MRAIIKDLRQRLKRAFVLLRFKPVQRFRVANRFTERGMIDDVEVTIIQRNTSEADAYTREELLVMLREIRIHEEIQQWTVPEPHCCGFCGHCSPTVKDMCPVVMETQLSPSERFASGTPKRVACLCPNHEAGLIDGWKEAHRLDAERFRKSVAADIDRALARIRDIPFH